LSDEGLDSREWGRKFDYSMNESNPWLNEGLCISSNSSDAEMKQRPRSVLAMGRDLGNIKGKRGLRDDWDGCRARRGSRRLLFHERSRRGERRECSGLLF